MKNTRTPTGGKKTPGNKDGTREKAIAQLKESLLERRDILRNLLEESNEPSHWGGETLIRGDVADVALGISRDELSFRHVESMSDELLQIEKSLEQIEDKSYGQCEMCDGLIPIARLKALPYADKCVTCQQAEEESRRSFPDTGPWNLFGSSSSVGAGLY